MEPVSEQPKDNGEVGQKTEKVGNHDDTVIFLLPGVLSPEVTMSPLKAYLKKHGFSNTYTIGLRWSIEKFEKLQEHAVEGIKKQVKEYQKSHNGNNPDNLVIVGYSNGGKVGAEAIEEIKDQFSAKPPKLITLSTPAREGERNYSPVLKKALSLIDSHHHKTVFPSKGWYSINSQGDKGATIERTTEDNYGNKPEEVITTEQNLSHVQMVDPRKTGPTLVNLLNRIVSK
jgi:hypothetical protein